MDEYIKSVLSNSKSVIQDTLEKGKLSADMKEVCNTIKKYAHSPFVILEDEGGITVLYVHNTIFNKSECTVTNRHVNYII